MSDFMNAGEGINVIGSEVSLGHAYKGSSVLLIRELEVKLIT